MGSAGALDIRQGEQSSRPLGDGLTGDFMERILFGDNQFFGINHMSEDKALAQAMKFQSFDAVIEIIDAAYEAGIKVFMCTTHDRISEVCDHVRANPAKYQEFQFYPCMPYAHKYANAVTEKGILETLKSVLPDEGALSALFGGAVSVARKDMDRLTELLVDAEMKMFHGLKTPVIFLQNVVTDLVLGLGMNELFATFSRHVRERYQAEPGFITMNTPLLLDALEEVNVDNPIVCSNINKIGFRMCGGIEVYERTMATRRFRPIAMSVLASGAIPAEEAIDYIVKQPKIESIVFGASSAENIRRTKNLIDRQSCAPRLS
jgi:hypothetical protein